MKTENQNSKVIDAHCHLNFPWFESDISSVIKRSKTSLKAIITSTVNPTKFSETIKIHENYPNFIYTCLGHEPQKNLKADIDSILQEIDQYRQQMNALGEVGLDYYWVKDPKIQHAQRQALIKYLEYAKTYSLPVVIHSRKAEKDCVDIIESCQNPQVYFHCFDGEHSLIDRITQYPHWMIGVATNVVYRKKTQELARLIPLEHLLIETDSPFLHPFKRRSRNEPTNVIHSAQKISELQNIPLVDVVTHSTSNAIRFFRIPEESL